MEMARRIFVSFVKILARRKVGCKIALGFLGKMGHINVNGMFHRLNMLLSPRGIINTDQAVQGGR